MASQLEMRKASLARLESTHGPDSPFVKGLKAQIARSEKPRAENPMDNFSVGTRSSDPLAEEAQPAPRVKSANEIRTALATMTVEQRAELFDKLM